MIKKIEISSEKAEITDRILRALPNWFGIESAIVEYVENVQNMPFWAVFEADLAVGFIVLGMVMDFGGRVSHLSHIGGAIAGALIVNYWRKKFLWANFLKLSYIF